MHLSQLLTVVVSLVAAAPPEQVHLALTEDEGSMRVSWATMVENDAGGAVTFGVRGEEDSDSVAGSSYAYSGDNFTGTLHSAVLGGLRDGARYEYVVSSASGERSETFNFTFVGRAPAISFLSYGDMGVVNSAGTIAVADALAATGNYDLLLNVGDTSYANDVGPRGNNSWVFDEHFRNIQAHASAMPFMSVPGNHEEQYDFKPYKNRLPMPRMPKASKDLAPFYYSFDLGPAHFLAYSSEVEHPLHKGSEQRAFIERDLAAANENRRARPWIVAFTHHPMYCSDLLTERTRCQKEAYKYREDLEQLFLENKLDLHISGHNHQYERSWGVYGCDEEGTKKCQISEETHNSPYPVYIVNGAGGDVEGIDPTWVPEALAPFRAFHGSGLRTGLATVDMNLTHLVWRFHYTGSGAWPHAHKFHWHNDSVGAAGLSSLATIDELVLTRDDPALPP